MNAARAGLLVAAGAAVVAAWVGLEQAGPAFFGMPAPPTIAVSQTPASGALRSVAGTVVAPPVFDERSTWAFEPAVDTFSAESMLDLRHLNEKLAGQTGFVRVDARGDFTTGDGRPLRFWAVNSNVGRSPHVQRPLWPGPAPDLARHARFLAKRGVNLVRLHRQIAPDLERTPDAPIDAINLQEREGIWRTVAAMKREGIYSVVSPYWAQITRLSPRWGLAGDATQSANGLLFFDPVLRAAYKSWLKQLLEPPNPHTGVPLAREPALAVFQLQNEDSLLFWTLEGIRGPQRDALESQYRGFLLKKYGNVAGLETAWQGDRDARDASDRARVAVLPAWEMTRDPAPLAVGRRARVADQTEFLTRTMDDFNRDIVSFLRNEIGLRMPINAGNWKTASVERLNDAERWSYRSSDVDAANVFTSGLHEGQHPGWAIVAGDTYTDASVLHQPWRMPLALRQGAGRPMMVTEASWILPTNFGAEGPLMVSAYSGLSGVDAYFWFSTDTEGFEAPRSANGYLASQSKWTFARPEVLGGFPAAALAHRRGDLKRDEPAVEVRALDDLWQRKLGRVSEAASFDPNRDDLAQAWATLTATTPTTFLEGAVQVTVDAGGRVPSAATPRQMAGAGDSVWSRTRQLEWNPVQGWLRVDSPRTQGVAAHFSRVSTHNLKDVRVHGGNHHAVLIATSMDNEPIASSARVLLQATTRSRPAGWRESPTELKIEGKAAIPGRRIDAVGSGPWRVERLDMRVSVHNKSLTRAVRLDANGMPSGDVPLVRSAQGVDVVMPADAMYVILAR